MCNDFTSGDRGNSPTRSDFDGTFLCEEEKYNFIEENPVKGKDGFDWFECPTCHQIYEFVIEACEGCPEDMVGEY